MCKVGAVKAREDGQERAHQVPLEVPWKGHHEIVWFLVKCERSDRLLLLECRIIPTEENICTIDGGWLKPKSPYIYHMNQSSWIVTRVGPTSTKSQSPIVSSEAFKVVHSR